jgi:cytochrome o ubiquinol oxidase subunit 2
MRRARTLAATALCLALAACSNASIMRPAGPVATQDKLILLNSLGIMLVIVVPTILATLGFAWWFRAGNARATYRPDFAYSGRIELVVWSIPILTILFLGGVIWIGSHQLDPAKPLVSNQPPLEVQVVSLDWKWLFIYPEQGIASVNRVVVPAGRPVHFSLTSASVMNSFFVPRLGSQIYAMNGMRTQVNLQADKPGSYFGTSAHFSGDGFSDMQFKLDALPPGGFEAWAAQARGTGAALDVPSYQALARQSQNDRPVTYRAVQPGLFDAITSQRLPPSDGPQQGRGGPGVKPVSPS